MRRILAVLGCAAAVAVVAASSPAPGTGDLAGQAKSLTEPPRPNIIVVMTDDQDARSMWAMPQTRKLLGRRGTTFTRAYAAFPLCCPSRATFLTGQHAHNHGVRSNLPPRGGHAVFDQTSTLAVWLRDAGYFTAHVGKYLNGYGEVQDRELTLNQARKEVPPGWSRWIGLVDPTTYKMQRYVLNRHGRLTYHGAGRHNYQTDVLGRISARLIRRFAGGDRPLFLSLFPLAPHRENLPGVDVNPKPAHRHRGASKQKPFRKRFEPPPSFGGANVLTKPEAIQGLPHFDRDIRRRLRAHYRGRSESLMAVDDAIAGIVRELRRAGELANTVIIFTSDNGYLLGEHRVPFGKGWLYEESIRVPLIIRGPGFPVGQSRSQFVSNVDLAPTILNAAGGVAPGLGSDGLALGPLARDPSLAASRAILLEGQPEGPRAFTGIRARGWAYLEHGPGAEELYDMYRDPFQLESLHDSPEHAAVKQELQAALASLQGCAGTAGAGSCYRELALPSVP